MSKKSIKQSLRKMLLAMPGGTRVLELRRRLGKHLQFLRKSDAKTVFRDRYEHNEWNNTESVSGPGSTLIYTENIRKLIPDLVEELGVRIVLDAPCGDFNWVRAIEWKTTVDYIGGDIVEDLVRINQTRYGTDRTRFMFLNIIEDSLPKADLWLCRDCLFHLSERDIFLTFDNFIRSDIPYILTSTHAGCDENRDIPTGAFRLLDLELPPYSLGKPIRVVDDWIEGFPVRYLALWKREAVRDALNINKAFQQARRSRREVTKSRPE